jgi:hypothetical protein
MIAPSRTTAARAARAVITRNAMSPIRSPRRRVVLRSEYSDGTALIGTATLNRQPHG